MLCYRCGSHVPDGSEKCSACGQIFASTKKDAPDAEATESAEAKAKRPARKVFPGMAYHAGDTLADRYALRDVLGSGGLGIVYVARDEMIDVDVAVKVIRPKLIHTDEERQTFTDELRRVRNLNHPNIARIYEDGADGEHLYFTMQLVEGITLVEEMEARAEQNRAFTPREIESFLTQICGALDYAHESLVHANLKPANVLVAASSVAPPTDDDGEEITSGGNEKAPEQWPSLLKLTDFGLGRAIPLKPFHAVQKTRGNRPYLAPEVRRAEAQTTGRADVYSVAVMLGELLTGLRYAGEEATLREAAVRAAAKLDADDTEQLGEATDLYDKIVDIVIMGVQSDPRSRYPAASDLLEDYRGVIDGAEPALRRHSVTVLEDDDFESVEDGTEPGKSPPPPPPDISGESTAVGADPASAEPPPPPEETGATAAWTGEENEPTLAGSADELDDVDELDAEIEEPEELDLPPMDVPGFDDDTAIGSGRGYAAGPVALDANDAAEAEFERAGLTAVAPPPIPGGATPNQRSGGKKMLPMVLALIAVLGIGGALLAVGGVFSGKGETAGKKPAVSAKPAVSKPPATSAAKSGADGGTQLAMAASKADGGSAAGPGTLVPKASPNASAKPLVPKVAGSGPDSKGEEKPPPLVKKPEAPDKAGSEKAAAGSEAAPKKPEPSPKPVEKVKPPEPTKVVEKAPAKPKKPEKQTSAASATQAPAKPRSKPDPPKPPPETKVASTQGTQPVPAARRGAKCPPGMIYIATGSFDMGSAPGDPMRSFGEKSLVRTKVRSYCIDFYEFPNRAGAAPRTGVTWYQAARECGKRGKRLCDEDEWEKACKGHRGFRFPYGPRFNAARCNTKEQPNGGGQVMPAGAFQGCRSTFGAYDMSGNSEEWTASAWSASIGDRVIKGGSANAPNYASRCASRGSQKPNSKDPYRGFRCCADAND